MSIRVLLLSLGILTTWSSTVLAQTTALTSPTDSISRIVGKWTGTFAGGSSGNLELNLKQDASKQLTGQAVVIQADGSRYSTDLKTVAIKNGKLLASYVDPDGANVTFASAYSTTNLEGTWEVNGGQASGTWQASHSAR